MKRGKSIITLILTLAMVFSSSAFAVFADTAADQEEQLDNAASTTEEVVEETPEVTAATTEQTVDVQEPVAEAAEPERTVTPAEEPSAETKLVGGATVTIGDHTITYADDPTKTDRDANGRWTYSGKTRTLTLTNFSSNEPIIFKGIDLRVVLEGNNKTRGIIEDRESWEREYSQKLGISGSGSLTIEDPEIYSGLLANAVEINGGDISIKNMDFGILAKSISITGGTVNIDDVRGALEANNISDNSKISIQGGVVNANGIQDGLYADVIDLSGGSIRATGLYAITGGAVTFRGNVYADIETIIPDYIEKDREEPAVYSWEKNGITLLDNVQIILPENAKYAPYKPNVSTNEVKEGTMIADSSGKPATHVIIERIKNPSGMLLAKAVAKGKTDLEISWTAMNDVDGYDVFFAPCNSKGKTYEPQLVASVKADTTSYTVPGLKKGTPYKAYVQAYITKQGAKQYVGASLLTHAFAGGSSKRFTNPKSVKVKKSKVSVKTGKKYKIRASVKKVKKSKKLIRVGHAPKLRYLSSNTSIATVSKKGNIKGVAPGTCTVYAIAANGVYKAVNVTVK